MLKIKNTILSSFLKQFKLAGSEEIEMCLLKFGDTGISISKMSASSTVVSEATLSSNAFESYEAIGNIGINHLNVFIKLIENFKEQSIKLVKEENKLSITAAFKTIKIEILDEKIFTERTPNLEYEHSFDLPKKLIKEIVTDAELAKNLELSFNTEKNLVKIRNIGKYEFISDISVPNMIEGISLTVGKPFIDAVASYMSNSESESIKLFINTNYPLTVVDTSKEHMTFKLIVAPIVKGEGE